MGTGRGTVFAGSPVLTAPLPTSAGSPSTAGHAHGTGAVQVKWQVTAHARAAARPPFALCPAQRPTWPPTPRTQRSAGALASHSSAHGTDSAAAFSSKTAIRCFSTDSVRSSELSLRCAQRTVAHKRRVTRATPPTSPRPTHQGHREGAPAAAMPPAHKRVDGTQLYKGGAPVPPVASAFVGAVPAHETACPTTLAVPPPHPSAAGSRPCAPQTVNAAPPEGCSRTRPKEALRREYGGAHTQAYPSSCASSPPTVPAASRRASLSACACARRCCSRCTCGTQAHVVRESPPQPATPHLQFALS